MANPGDQYYPSNGTEGGFFEHRNCEECIKSRRKQGCSIHMNAMMGTRPKQWVYDEKLVGVCTAIKRNGDPVKKRIPKNQTTLEML